MKGEDRLVGLQLSFHRTTSAQYTLTLAKQTEPPVMRLGQTTGAEINQKDERKHGVSFGPTSTTFTGSHFH